MVRRVRRGLATLELAGAEGPGAAPDSGGPFALGGPSPFGTPAGLEGWVIGGAFAFQADTADPSGVVFLGDPRGARLGSAESPVSVCPEPFELPELVAVFTDKELYREGRDVVRIAVFAPARAGATAEVALRLNGQPLVTLRVAIGRGGLGLYEHPEPVAGEYAAAVGAATARFVVAEYKLAPLTARFDGHSLSVGTQPERLAFAACLETFGAPFSGPVRVQVLDHGSSPGLVRAELTLTADARGRVEGEVELAGIGPFALALHAVEDPQKTASLPVPGSRAAERAPLELSRWRRLRTARLMPVEGSTEVRGLYLAEQELGAEAAPLSLSSVERARARVRLEEDAQALRLVALDPASGRFEHVARGPTAAGTELELPLGGAWTLLFAGVSLVGRYYEGRAAVPRPVAPPLDLRHPERSEPSSIDVVARAEPGARVTVKLRGPAEGAVFLVVKDERLQVTDTPVAASAASLRRQIEAGLGRVAEWGRMEPLSEVLAPPLPPPPMLMMPGAGLEGAGAFPVAVPRRAHRASPRPTAAAAPSAQASAAQASADPAPRAEGPEVVLARVVELDAQGRAEVEVQLGQAMGSVKVEAFSACGWDWSASERAVLVTRPVFGELVLPRFVRAGDPAEGRLYVRVADGEAEVRLSRDGRPVGLRGEGGEAERAVVRAPGATLGFDASPGRYAAEVRGGGLVDRAEGVVEEPGKLVWLQRAVRLLSPGERVDLDAPGALSLALLPSLDTTFDRMLGGLRAYEHACCEQTSAVLLAAAAAFLTARDEETRAAAALHVRGCVEREKRMHLPGRGFKGWPSSPDEVFVYSPGATLNLLQVDLLRGHPLPSDLARAVDECLAMAEDAARAHGIDPAPAAPRSAREAYGRAARFAEERARMADFVRSRVERWQGNQVAILRFELPGMPTETYRPCPAMIRAESAYGAAVLLEGGPAHRPTALALASTVLGALREDGSLYSTLDSVAAMTLLAALRRAPGIPGPETKLRADGAETTYAAAVGREDLRSVEALESSLQVELKRLVEEDYTALDHGVEAKVELRRGGRALRGGRVRPGDALELAVSLTSGYVAGDLLHVFLPDCLSWVHGGGQVKKFSLDFAGKPELTVPLAVTGATFGPDGAPAAQHFAVAVRNMYDEARGKGFGALRVTVDPSGDEPGLADRVLRGLKTLLG